MPKLEMPTTIEEIILPRQANPDGRYTCCYCDTIVTRRYDLRRHVLGTHINARPYRCVREDDGCTFSGANQKGNLTQHYNTSPHCEDARLKTEAEDAASKPMSPAVLVKAEHTTTLTADAPEIPASICASVAKPKRTPRLGTHRAMPYSTSHRQGPPASEASTSRISRRQAQATSDVSWGKHQVATPSPRAQLFPTYPVQQYQRLGVGSYEQTPQPHTWQSDETYNASYHSSQLGRSFQQPQLIPEYDLLSASYPEATSGFPQCDMSTIDPALLSCQENITGFKSTGAPLDSCIPDFSSGDDALSMLYAATQTSGGIDHLQKQVDAPLLREGDDYEVPTTLPQSDPLDTALLDTSEEYDRFLLGWKTGYHSLLEPTVDGNNSSPEPTFDWSQYTPNLEDPMNHDLVAGYVQNLFWRCPSPVAVSS